MTDSSGKFKMFELLHSNEICRLCLIPGKDMSPIFSRPSDEKSISIPYRIMAFTSIKLETGDGLPGLICRSCLLNVERVYEFKRQCEQADVLLREYFAHNNLEDVKNIKLESMDHSAVNSIHHLAEEPDFNNMNIELNDIKSESLLAGSKKGLLKYEEQLMSCSSHTTTPGVPVVNDNDIVDDTGCHMLADSEMFRCSTCNKPCVAQDRFERHITIHNQDGTNFPCEYCELEFGDRTSLRWHWRAHARVGELQCMTCGETSATRQAYDLHATNHDAVKRHLCQLCDRRFSTRSDLRKHVVIHTGVRPYMCKTCGKCFTRSTNLNKHARAHVGDRPFDCSECKKKFSTRGDLARHAVTHTGVRPHACTICGMAFSRRDKLNRHVGLHAKVRAFQCGDCVLSFNNRKALTAHISIHHGNAAAATSTNDDTKPVLPTE